MRSFVVIILGLLVPLAAAVSRTDQKIAVLIGKMTDHRQYVFESGMRGLAQMGAAVLPDLRILAADANPEIRARVAKVAGRIGNESAVELLLEQLDDRSLVVREVAIISLGATRSQKTYQAVRGFLQSPSPALREATAIALGATLDFRAIGDLTAWPEAGGREHLLSLARGSEGQLQRKRVQIAMQKALNGLVNRSEAVPTIIELMGVLKGHRLDALVEATWKLGDPRLCPPLIELLATTPNDTQASVIVSLSANGDSRCLEILCRRALGKNLQLANLASKSLRSLTGYKAGPGKAWQLWWQQHEDRVNSLAKRDAFIAQAHDLKMPVTAKQLAAFSPEQLWPLIDGMRGDGALWWPQRAGEIFQLDDARRWLPVLEQRLAEDVTEREKVALVLIIDSMNSAAGRAAAARLLQQLEADHPEGPSSEHGSLRLALKLAAED